MSRPAPLRLFFITNQPTIAAYVGSCGVDRIFVDLEHIGKEQRQPNLNSIKNFHTPDDIRAIRDSCKHLIILARINPYHSGSRKEIEDCISAGANIIMLPMFRRIEEIYEVAACINRKALFCPLIETWDAVAITPLVVAQRSVDEVYFGLNDLAIAQHKKFMFQSFVDGSLEDAFASVRQSKKPFGVGGIARLGHGLLSAELILKEHVRVGSNAVILSQSFHNSAKSLSDLKSNLDLPNEIYRLKNAYKEACELSEIDLQENKKLLFTAVNNIVSKM